MTRFTRSSLAAGIVLAVILAVAAPRADGQNTADVVKKLRGPTTSRWLLQGYSGDVTLKEALELISNEYKVPIRVHTQAFARDRAQKVVGDNPPDFENCSLERLSPCRGLRLASTLQMLLDQTNSIQHGTFVVQGGTIWIVPGMPRIVDESRTSPLTAKLRQTTDRFKGNPIPNLRLGEALALFTQLSKVPVIVHQRSFRDRNPDAQDLLDQEVSFPQTPRTTFAAALQQTLQPLRATFIVRGDHVLIVPIPDTGPIPFQ